MKQFFLKFDNEAQAKEALAAYVSNNQWLDEAPVGSWITASKDHALDVIGTVYAPTGETLVDSEGIEYPEMAPIEGFHVNLMVQKLPKALKTYAAKRKDNPYRLFSGAVDGDLTTDVEV